MTAPRLSRRALVQGAAASAGLVGLGAVGGYASSASQASTASQRGWGADATVSFYGKHQAGVDRLAASNARYLVFDLLQGVSAEGIRRMLRIITEDTADLMAGRPPLADSEPELALVPANLVITVGFGHRVVSRAAGKQAAPDWLGPLPRFPIDDLRPEWTGGDLLIILQADDPVSISHAARVITRQIRSFVSVRWSLDGFRRARGSEPRGTTMRNLFGQVDGTAGPHPGDEAFGRVVWGEGISTGNPRWLDGGTALVIRRIRMDLDTWDEVDRPDRERSIGRTLSTGSPLTGGVETDPADFEARDARGVPIIPDFAHMRRARPTNPSEVIARRGYNYEVEQGADGRPEAGLVFEAFGYDPNRQFVPIQQRLANMDMLNLWTTPVGSGVFAIPPGCGPGGYIGDTLV